MGTALYRALKAANVPDDLAVAAAAEPFVTKADLAEFVTKTDLALAVAKLENRILAISLPAILSTIGIATGLLAALIIKVR